MSDKPTIAFKGFDHKWQCRGFQYAVDESYEHAGKVQACHSGFHACEMPLNVFDYYPPASDGLLNSFALVECSGEIHRDGGDSKIAAARIHIKAELSIPQLVGHMVSWVMGQIDKSIPQAATNTGDRSAATNTGYRSAATNTGNYSAATNTGYQSAATNTGNYSAATNTGDQSAATNTGDQSAATNTGYQSAATNTGYQSAATNTGNYSAATNTGNYSAATNTGNYSAATNTGNYSAATNTGYQSAATNTGNYSAATNTGDQSAAVVEGKHSVAASLGYEGKAMAVEGSAIVLCKRNEKGELLYIRAGVAGRDIEPNTWYMLDDKGEFVEVKACPPTKTTA